METGSKRGLYYATEGGVWRIKFVMSLEKALRGDLRPNDGYESARG